MENEYKLLEAWFVVELLIGSGCIAYVAWYTTALFNAAV